MSLLGDLEIALMPAALVIALFLPALAFELWHGGSRGSAALTGIGHIRDELGVLASNRKRSRVVVLGTLVLLLGALWAAPTVQSERPLLAMDQLARQKNLLLAIDVSRSMSGPLETPDRDERFAAYGQAPETTAGQSRYAAARDTAYRFIDRFPEARVGLILFSTEPFLARWPTVDTGNRFIEVLEENLRDATELRRFSSLTNTDAALRLAQSVFTRLGAVGGAVVHISDAEDDLENMGAAIRALRSDGIRLYTIGVGISESIVTRLEQEFGGDPGFRIFRADSEAEMAEAFSLVAELEEAPQYAAAEKAYVTQLRWIIALLLAPLSLLAIWLLEIRLHRSDFVPADERRRE